MGTKRITTAERATVEYEFLNSKENTARAIAARTGIKEHRINIIISDYLGNKKVTD